MTCFLLFFLSEVLPKTSLSLASYLIFDDPPPRPSQILVFTRKIAHGACCGGSYTHRLWCDPGNSRIAGSTQGPSEYLQFLLRSGKARYRSKGELRSSRQQLEQDALWDTFNTSHLSWMLDLSIKGPKLKQKPEGLRWLTYVIDFYCLFMSKSRNIWLFQNLRSSSRSLARHLPQRHRFAPEIAVFISNITLAL